MSIKELRKLKKLLLQANTPSKEESIAKALRVIFQDVDTGEGISLDEAYKIIGWCD